MRARYLIALEEERFENLPEPAYTRGMIRAYARDLALDPDPLVSEYDRRVGGPPEAVPAPAVDAAPRRRGRARANRPVGRRRRRDTRWVWASVGAALVATSLVWIGTSRGPERVTPLAPLPDAPATTAGRTEPRAPATTRARRVPPVAASAGTVRLVGVDGGSWVQVRRGGADGAVLYEGTLAAGASRRFPLGARLWARLGWGPGLRASVGGRPAALPPGTADVVITRDGVTPAAG